MLDIFEVTTADGRFMSFPIRDISDGYLISDIKGLDPVKADLVSSSFALLPGARFQAGKRGVRNIVVTVKFLANQVGLTVEQLRTKLYQFLMPESHVVLRFINVEGLSVRIQGVVESFEAPLFVKDPMADISIICHDPDLIETNEITVSGNTVSDTTEMLVDYEGTIPTGFRLVLYPNRTITNFTLHHRNSMNVSKQLYLARTLNSGDVVTINTVLGDKYARLTSGGVETSIVGNVSPQSSWSQMSYGENYFRVVVSGASIPYSVFYMNRYGGL